MNKNKKYKILYKIKNQLNCRWEDLLKLSDEQVDYVNQYIVHSCFLQACPGSGKTEVIGIKAALEMHRWRAVNGGIAVLTFTVSAGKEINNRVRKYGGDSAGLFPHYIGTFDSWIHNYLLQPFGHSLVNYSGKEGDKSIRLVDVDSSAGFLSNYTSEIVKNKKRVPIKVTEYYYDFKGALKGHTDKTDGLLNSGITKEEKQSLLDKKKQFIIAGFATYADVEWICGILLTKHPALAEKLSKRFPVIIVDECQDLSKGQIHILDKLRTRGTSLHFVGDLNQSIYEFREVNPTDVISYVQVNQFIVRKLTNNFRSCQPIVNVFERIIGNTIPVIGHEEIRCTTPCVLWQYSDETFSQLPERFSQFIQVNGLDKNNSAILSRGKTTIAAFRTQIDKFNYTKVELFALAFHNWHKPNRNTEDIHNALFYLGRVLCLLAYAGKGDARNQYCPEGTSPVDWRLFLKQLLESAAAVYPYYENGLDLSWSGWTPKLRTFLQRQWQTLGGKVPVWSKVVTKLRVPDNRGDTPVKEICTRLECTNLIRTTTIHSVKGETLNAVLLVSHQNKQSKGGHFSHWLPNESSDPEYLRFAYVACSRPKYALIIATPELSFPDRQKIESLGFLYVP